MAGVCKGECLGRSRDATVVGCHSYMKPLKGGGPFVVEPTA